MISRTMFDRSDRFFGAALDRRAFLRTLAGVGMGAAALAALPPWIRSAAATGVRSTAPGLIERNVYPEHWETALAALDRSWITPADRFFVRSHFPAPSVDPATWRLEVTGLVRSPFSLDLAGLRALPTTEATHVLECAGNGRGLFPLRNTSGTQWGPGAVGNAMWGGVRLAHLLARAEPTAEAAHVWFEAADQAPLPDVPRFVRSIPLDKAMRDVLLAHHMNGLPLPRLHGAPLRAVVPGWYGMASTKWLVRVRVAAAPSDNHFMVKGYRYVPPGGDPAASPPVEGVRVKSVITHPLEGARVPRGPLEVRGFAWAGPAGVRQIEVSSDGGALWRPASFVGPDAGMAWRGFTAQVPVRRPGPMTLEARATDGTGEVQPDQAPLNSGGYGNNSIHRVTVDVGA